MCRVGHSSDDLRGSLILDDDKRRQQQQDRQDRMVACNDVDSETAAGWQWDGGGTMAGRWQGSGRTVAGRWRDGGEPCFIDVSARTVLKLAQNINLVYRMSTNN